MKTKLENLSRIATLTALSLLPLPLLAGQFTVNSHHDPAVGDPVACLQQQNTCTLRDALAAADQDALMDEITFDVTEPIYLATALTATQPVTIDGGGSTSLRVDQSYSSKILPDRPFFGDGDVLVVQPVFKNPGDSLNVMMNVYGAGSVIKNLSFDGSITPADSDLGVDRVDYDANDTTDYYLYTVSADRNGIQKRWPIAGGIHAHASATISGNTFNHFRNNPIIIDFSDGARVTDNTISGDAAVNEGFFADGISFYASIFSVVSGNTISGFTSGVRFLYSSALSVSENELTANTNGLELDTVGTDYGPVSVSGNIITGNIEAGVYVRESLGVDFSDNEVNKNAQRGFFIQQAGEINIANNQVNHNGSGEQDHGGILVNDGSGFVSVTSNSISHNNGFGMVIDASFANVLVDNEINKNLGAGVILLNGAQWNQVLTNTIRKNAIGVISGLEGNLLFPGNNLFQGNTLVNNQLIDALDYDPVCNDAWVANNIGSSASVSAACIEP